jgi:hypothetical protein
MDSRNIKAEEVKPKLIGHLNLGLGYQGYKLNEPGTEVYEFEDRYLFYLIPLNGGIPTPIKFHKEILKPYINFI